MAGAAEAADRYWVPERADAVVVTLPGAAADGTGLDRLRHQLRAEPDDSALAATYITAALKLYAATGNPRFLGYADGVMQPWQQAAEPPRSLWLLRGRLTQTQHRFADAAADLEALLQQHPGNIEALLLAADARRRNGDLNAVRRHCLGLQLAGEPFLARLCAADLHLSLGEFSTAYDLAQAAIADMGSAQPADVREWAHSISGDAALVLRRYGDAEAAYKLALGTTGSAPLALNLSLADVYIATGREVDAWNLLDDLPPADAVRLRQAIVARTLYPERFESLRASLQDEFALTGDDDLHWRERAMFALYVEDNPAAAEQFARRNWEVQKAWEDAALLKEAATAAGDDSDLAVLDDWRKQWQEVAP